MPADTAVIFDCDGVLFDSWRANVAYYDAIRAHLGLPPMDAPWRERVHVLAASHVLEEMFGSDDALLAAARLAARGVSYEPFFALMAPVPGLPEVLDVLAPRFRLAMATNRGSTVHGVVARFGLERWLETAVGERPWAPVQIPTLRELPALFGYRAPNRDRASAAMVEAE